MINLFVCLGTLLFLFALSLFTSQGKYINSQIFYALGFVVALFGATIYAERWQMEFASETSQAIILSAVLFFSVATLVDILYGKVKRKKKVDTDFIYEDDGNEFIDIDRLVLLFLLGMQLIMIVFQYYFLMRFGGASSIIDAIYKFRFREDTDFNYPTIIKLFLGVSQALGYYLIYSIIHGIVYRYKPRNIFIIIANLIICLLSILMSGSRGTALAIFIAGFIQFYILLGKKNSWSVKLKVKQVAIIAAIIFLLVISFKSFGDLMGRGNEKFANGEYLAIYFSGSILNLDNFVKSHRFGAPINQNETFIRLINNISDFFDVPALAHKSSFTFTFSNGHFIGNVYTALAAFLHDGGYTALIILTCVMAALSQLSCNTAITSKFKKGFSYSIILYSFIGTTVFLSFFSARFYLDLFNKNFVQTMIYWAVIQFLFSRVKFTFHDRRL